jgi:hypothetical protein
MSASGLRGLLALEIVIAKLGNIICSCDISYVSRDRAETSVLFELMASRYVCRSILVANQSFGEWVRSSITQQ